MSDAGDPPSAVIRDLVEQFPQAHARAPTGRLELERRAVRPHLIRGWSSEVLPLPGKQDRLGIASLGHEAELEFFTPTIGDLELSFWCAPVNGRAQPIVVLVNGRLHTDVTLEEEPREYRLTLPASSLRTESNRLLIRHDNRENGDGKPQVLWDYISFGPAREPTGAFSRDEKDTIFIPFGYRLDYAIDVATSAHLRVEDVWSRGSASGRLELVWTSQDGTEETLAHDLTALPSPAIDLGDRPRAGGSLSLLALSPGASSPAASSGIVLRGPRLRSGSLPPASRAPAIAHEGETRVNVVLYMVDTLRADHLGCYGYDRETSPHLDRFAREATLFEHAQAQSPWTKASVASLFTGLWPQSHGATGDGDTLAEQAVTLAELLRDQGYQTAGFTANGNAHEPAGFAQGFNAFKYLRQTSPESPLARSGQINEAVSDWLQSRADDRPFFLWVHTIDPHAPYDPPEPFRTRFAAQLPKAAGSLERLGTLERTPSGSVPEATLSELRDLYDAEIAANDESFGALLEELRRRSLFRDALVIFVADHGEEFYEHGSFQHGKTLYREMLEIPLVIKPPGRARQHRSKQVVQLVDVFATILDVVGAPTPDHVQGRSLTSISTGLHDSAWIDESVAHVDLRGNRAASLIHGQWKLIRYRPTPGTSPYYELFDRGLDPNESTSRSEDRGDVVRSLAALLEEYEQGAVRLAPGVLSVKDVDETKDELRALGYLD